VVRECGERRRRDGEVSDLMPNEEILEGGARDEVASGSEEE
jgi:hypothetical protein